MKERLLAAYFSEGTLVSDHEQLVALATEVGLEADETRAMLASDRYADAVRADESDAQQLGISGVPTFIVDRQIGVTGAQEPEMLLQMLRQGWDRRAPVIMGGGEGDSCGVDGC